MKGLTADPIALGTVSWNMRGAWLLQTDGDLCESGQEPCRTENLHALVLLMVLCSLIVSIICAFAFFREDKEEQITPLCPQLVVKDLDLRFKMVLDSQVDTIVVTDLSNQPVCKVAMDWPDPFRPGASGVAATVRLQNNLDLTLATVVARPVTVVGQGLALCRAGCEVFGFVEPEGPRRYCVRHRSGVHLLTLMGDFASIDVEGINPVGSKVCWLKKVGDECTGRVLQHVDAGLVICSLLATHVHRRISNAVPPSLSGKLPYSPEEPAEEVLTPRSPRQAEAGFVAATAPPPGPIAAVAPPAPALEPPPLSPPAEPQPGA